MLATIFDKYYANVEKKENKEERMIVDTPRGVTYPYPILVGYADTDSQIHHFSGISFDKVRIPVSDTYCIGYPYPYWCNTVQDTFDREKYALDFSKMSVN
jgi:hypothetical protein